MITRLRHLTWRGYAVVALVSLLLVELCARVILGLGDPPLMLADPTMEYRLQPGNYRRFGNAYRVNDYSMRSSAFAPHKADARELRVLFLGDSVINGGTLVDQDDLATEVLRREISGDLGRPVVVGNASAKSWGPPNLLAYVQRFGVFDSDIVVIVLSSHDVDDVPSGRPVVGVDPDYPARSPVLALEELIGRYAPRVLPSSRGRAAPPPPPDVAVRSLNALRTLILKARSTGAGVIVAQHLERDERPGREKWGHGLIRRCSEEAGARVIQLGPAMHRPGASPYLDEEHPNTLGHRLIAEALRRPIEAVAAGR